MKDLKNQKHYLINFRNKLINTKEIIDSILLHLDLNGKEGMNIGNVLKYVIRYKNKNGIEVLKKARVFLASEIGDDPQGTIKALEYELNKVIDRNIELEMENERLNNKIHNLKIDFYKEKENLDKGLTREKIIQEKIITNGKVFYKNKSVKY